MANPYHPYQSEANMMAALEANSNQLEKAAQKKRNAANLKAGIQESKKNENRYHQKETEVASYLQEAGLEKIKTEGDGNCFFYAVQGYGQIKGRQEMSVSVFDLRTIVAKTIETNPQFKNYFESPDKLKTHIKNITNKKQNTWADEVDVAAFSDHFKVCIVVHDWHENNQFPYHIKQLTYPDRCDIKRDSTIIHILRTNMNHYSLLMPIHDPEYDAIKLFFNGMVALPMNQDVAMAQQNQIQQMERHVANASYNLSTLHLNRPYMNQAALKKSNDRIKRWSEKLGKIEKILKSVHKESPEYNIVSNSAELIRKKIADEKRKKQGGTRKRRTRQARNKNKSRRRL